ncbi:Melanoma-associated antigen B4 [Cricetulus griseus]|uniref:Melanoma-associated antigen B4 n=1 Tax=Cricetulus griseus TaxID=10029 RepID=G3IL19_CRIGR|nr:Melanoma-associated antigen B4 [Cricetulus griseus]ERE65741.1 melanoma-associated antigen B4-like protein [Cricetulus griseus]
MPRGNKSKSRSRAKRQQARGESQSLQGALPTAKEEAAATPLGQGDAPSSPDVSTPQGSQKAASHGSPELDMPCSGYEVGAESSDAGAEGSDVGAELSVAGVDEKRANACTIAEAIDSARRDPMTRKASKVLHYLLEKYQKDEQPLEADMLKLISRKYKVHFPWILEKATYQLEVVYGLELKADKQNPQSYVLVSKLPILPGANEGGRKELPKTGLILTLLGMIMMKGDRASEEEVWQFLHMQGIYPGRRHLIFGEPRKFITKELVEQNYVEYRQVPGSNPPSYEFLWGSRARNEDTKMKVLDVLTKIRNAMPSYYPQQYEEALSNQAERAARRGEASGYHAARVPSHFHSTSSSHT